MTTARLFPAALFLLLPGLLSADTGLTIQASFKEAFVGTPYSAALDVTGGVAPFTWTLKSGSLPYGLALSAAGVISGTPTTEGSFAFTVGVADSAGASTTAQTNVVVAVVPLTILTQSLQVATVGLPYNYLLYTEGGEGFRAWSITSGSLPPGLSLSGTFFGQITGTPSTVGSWPLTIQVIDAGGVTASAQYRLVVNSTSTNLPSVSGVTSSASYATTIAQGSLVVLFGDSMGPDQLVQATSFPLPLSLAGTSVTVTSQGVTLDCPVVYTSSKQVAVILPSNTPITNRERIEGYFAVTYNSGTDSPYAFVNFTVVASAPGLYTLDSSGLGPGIFTTQDGSVKTFTNAAHPGEIITAWATGLGATSGDDRQPPPVANVPGVEVYVGNQLATLYYAGRSPCCSGLDQISFQVPQIGDGCFVSVLVRIGGALSKSVTLPVSSAGSQCPDSEPALPTNLYSRAEKGESLKIAAFAVGPQDILAAGGFPQIERIAALLSAAFHTPVSKEDATRIVAAFQKNDDRAIRRALSKYRRQWKALNATAKNTLEHSVQLSQNAGAASFFTLNSSAVLISKIVTSAPSPGSCALAGPVPTRLSTYTTPLDASTALTLIAPTGQVKMSAIQKGRYAGLLGASSQGPSVPPGTYTISGPGGADLGTFNVQMNVGNPLHWTNPPAAIDRSQPLTIAWSGGTVPGHVVFGASQGNQTVACSEDTAKGLFTIPAVYLSTLDPTREATFFIGAHPLEHAVSVPGLDYAVFTDASSDSRILPVK